MAADIEESLIKLKDRGVTSVEYFHCDHFEPWRHGVQETHADDIMRFLELARESWFGSRMTLFYKPKIGCKLVTGDRPDSVISLPDEPIVFLPTTDPEFQIARRCMNAVVRDGHEIQVHIHHEGFTASDIVHVPEVRDWLTAHGTDAADEARLDLAIKLHLAAIRAETGLPLKEWAFVHGNWALNGSDHSICRIKNEIQILLDNGCYGDMTFPAGRRVVDPTIAMSPYSVVPNEDNKGYDFQAAEPQPLTSAEARAAGRFMIWHSYLAHPLGSLDYSSLAVQKQYLEPDKVVDEWLTKSPQFDDRLYIKTCAHSMNRLYWEGLKSPVIPHQFPAIQRAFSTLAESCEKLGLNLNLVTVDEVRARLMSGSLPVEKNCLFVEDHGKSVTELRATGTEGFLVTDHSSDKSAGYVTGFLNEKAGKDEMDRLWTGNTLPTDRPRSLEIASTLYQRFGTRSAAYRLGLAAYLGKGTGKNLDEAYRYFSDPGLLDNLTVSYYKANILLDPAFSGRDPALVEAVLTNVAARSTETTDALPANDAWHNDRIDAVDRVAVDALAARIDQLGEKESGAYAFYAKRVERKRLTIDTEIQLRDKILDCHKGFGGVHDIGAGIGTLALAFAAVGKQAVAIERDHRRIGAISAIHSAITASEPRVADRFSFVHAAFPSEDVRQYKTPDTIAVLTNFIATIPEDVQLDIIRGLATYQFAVVDVQRFCAYRKNQGEQDELFALFSEYGLVKDELLLDRADNGLFYRFVPGGNGV